MHTYCICSLCFCIGIEHKVLLYTLLLVLVVVALVVIGGDVGSVVTVALFVGNFCVPCCLMPTWVLAFS